MVRIDDCPNGPARQHHWLPNGLCEACGGQIPDTPTQFAQRLESLLNAHSQENASDTPDFLLAEYLVGCLTLWNQTVQARERWYGRGPRTIAPAGTPTKLVGWSDKREKSE
jgi:hypothetical protein